MGAAIQARSALKRIPTKRLDGRPPCRWALSCQLEENTEAQLPLLAAKHKGVVGRLPQVLIKRPQAML
jgi:hypothetical protein